MEYKSVIDPALRRIAVRMPFNRPLIRCANLFLALAWPLTPTRRGVSRRTVTVAGHRGLPVKVHIFAPDDAAGPLPGLLYVHGGAFSYRAAPHHKKLACLYALRARCAVCFPDYHLAPRCPYPAGCEDALALYRAMADRGAEWGVDGARLAVGGDSAGAAIAGWLCNRWEQEALPRPCAQLLLYPVTDSTMQTESMEKYKDAPLWNADSNRYMWSLYCGGQSAGARRGASLLHDRLPRSIPDTYLETAEFDCLHDEGILYGARLRQAGARVTLRETRGTIHGYDAALGAAIAMDGVERRAAFLRQAFYGIPPRRGAGESGGIL